MENEDGSVQCNQCAKRFKRRNNFAIHYYKIHKEKTLKCNHCDRGFAHTTLLNYHLKKCNGKPVSHFQRKENITYRKIENGKYSCVKCEKVFNKIASFYTHYGVNHKEKSLKCNQCDKSFSLNYKLQNHIRKCDGTSEKCSVKSETTFRCDICDRTFSKMYLLKNHYKTHNKAVVKSKINSPSYKMKICRAKSVALQGNSKANNDLENLQNSPPDDTISKCKFCEKVLCPGNCNLKASSFQMEPFEISTVVLKPTDIFAIANITENYESLEPKAEKVIEQEEPQPNPTIKTESTPEFITDSPIPPVIEDEEIKIEIGESILGL